MPKPRAILFDMDGVLYNSDRLIPGAAETVAWLRSRSIPHLFVTNTTSRRRAVLVEKLRAFGIQAHEQDILTPPIVVADWLRKNGEGPAALFVRPKTIPDFHGIPTVPDQAETGASYVVIGDLGELWNFATLNRAFRLLHHNPDAKLIALGMTRYWLASDGISLDVAPFVAALEHATGRQAMVFGKPAARFFHAAVELLGVSPGETLMIGDDVRADVGGAQAAGLRGALVKTGKFRPSDLEIETKPEFVLDSVADLPRWWTEGGAGS
jgi:phospholysine phosphohistidine inorganic pyrophosphate phosphatase